VSATVNKRMPPLIALRAFEAVGRTGSIRAAGDELGVSHTVVSRHVRNLEEYIGADLIEQHGRGIVLTAQGRRFHTRISGSFSDILRATAELSPTYRRSLEVWCMPGIAHHLLLSVLDELRSSLPDVDLSFKPTLERPDLAHGQADAEIFYLDRTELDEAIRYEELARPRVFPVASPDFAGAHPEIRRIEDLLVAPLLHEQSTRYWTAWFAAAGMADIPALPGPKLWHANFTLDAATQGRGIALANDVLIQRFRSGLVELLETRVTIGAYYLIVPTSRWNEADIKVLAAWAKRALSA
jgi:DNA-binding transcriptional LysR family regulator